MSLIMMMFVMVYIHMLFFFFSSRRRHTRLQGDWSSDVCSSDLGGGRGRPAMATQLRFKTRFSGRAWALPDSCDTDMITPGKYLTIIDPKGLAEQDRKSVV